jgi:DMSO/TMAO reductase YedYZ molybdopterin-dependent catalytic subunit
MSIEKKNAESDRLAREVLRGETGRRGAFHVAAWGAAAAMAAPDLALAQAPAAPAAPARRIIQKDDARLLNIGATVRSGRYWEFTTWQTPVEQFYVRNHYPTPTAETRPVLDRANWRLRIHGNGIERELEIGYEDLLRMPSRTLLATMECHGNARTIFWEQQGMREVTGGNWVMGAIGLAEWRYVPMSHILGLVGLKPTARACLFWSGVDGNDMGRPLPVSELRSRGDDIGICYQMNGNDLWADHGAPVRAFVPGYGGAASTKWLTEIKIAEHDFWTRLNVAGEVYIGPSFTAPRPAPGDEFRGATPEQIRGPMVEWMPVKSTLTVPMVIEHSQSLPANYPLQRGQLPMLAAGRQTMRGYAWGPQHGLSRVDFRINGGAWAEARILPPNLGRYTWARFEFPWDAPAGDHVIETRATDGAGNVQPAEVPFNLLGMANNAIPKFRIRVA